MRYFTHLVQEAEAGSLVVDLDGDSVVADVGDDARRGDVHANAGWEGLRSGRSKINKN